jgi:hypothetical protein
MVMGDTAFAIHLSGNIYLDSNGNLIQGAPEKAPVYNPAFQACGAAGGAGW